MSSPLYNRAILALAVEAVCYAPLGEPMLAGEERAALCGSHLSLGLNLDEHGKVVAVGMKVQACALGQASATLFARHIRGKNAAAFSGTCRSIADWLAGRSDEAGWPDMAILKGARDYPARHGAILLPFVAAERLLAE